MFWGAPMNARRSLSLLIELARWQLSWYNFALCPSSARMWCRAAWCRSGRGMDSGGRVAPGEGMGMSVLVVVKYDCPVSVGI